MLWLMNLRCFKQFNLFPVWGIYKNHIVKAEEFIGIWMLLNKIPVVNVWQAPNTFWELIEACKNQNLNSKSIQRLAPRIRDGKKHFC